ncbi:hypothetical protein [Lichenicoccus roseus]|uniref:hypothetical protein n=1 Tax=Lichenicoccus roseus TaxID=2683649 RepID=UPI001485E54E|nr:hypothetical protein [Lichenicoccus roseus]
MAEHAASSDHAPLPTTAEALMADRQLFWARFCRAAFWAVMVVIAIVVLLDWTLV